MKNTNLIIDTNFQNEYQLPQYYINKNTPFYPISNPAPHISKTPKYQINFNSITNTPKAYFFNTSNSIPSNYNNNNSNYNNNNSHNYFHQNHKTDIIKPKPLNTVNIDHKPNFIDIDQLFKNENHRPITLDFLTTKYQNFDKPKTSTKSMGIIKSYSVNTFQGLIRNYNEDRVSIIINMNRPKNFNSNKANNNKIWPKVSFFGIYDGHGGKTCAEYLRDNLHKYICENKNFPSEIEEAIKEGFEYAERDFLNNYTLNKNKNLIIDKSGSCAVIMILIDTKIYIANVGDSRAVMSCNNGREYKSITIDHKPNSINEKNRIIKNGGKVYQSQTPLTNINNNNNNVSNDNNQILVGPYRVFPGRLSVSRTIGDVEAKNKNFGGNPNVIISKPEIFVLDVVKDNIDFIIMGCDGIFDQLNNKDVCDCAWMILNKFKNDNIHVNSSKIVEFVMKCAMGRKSFDNVTCLFLNFKEYNNNIVNNNMNNKKNNSGIKINNKNNSSSENISYNISKKKIINENEIKNENIINNNRINNNNSDIKNNNNIKHFTNHNNNNNEIPKPKIKDMILNGNNNNNNNNKRNNNNNNNNNFDLNIYKNNLSMNYFKNNNNYYYHNNNNNNNNRNFNNSSSNPISQSHNFGKTLIIEDKKNNNNNTYINNNYLIQSNIFKNNNNINKLNNSLKRPRSSYSKLNNYNNIYNNYNINNNNNQMKNKNKNLTARNYYQLSLQKNNNSVNNNNRIYSHREKDYSNNIINNSFTNNFTNRNKNKKDIIQLRKKNFYFY